MRRYSRAVIESIYFGIMHFTKANWFLVIFSKFQKRVNRFKSKYAWLVIIQFFGIQTSNAIYQPLECGHISEVAFNFCDSGVKQRKLWSISCAENINRNCAPVQNEDGVVCAIFFCFTSK